MKIAQEADSNTAAGQKLIALVEELISNEPYDAHGYVWAARPQSYYCEKLDMSVETLRRHISELAAIDLIEFERFPPEIIQQAIWLYLRFSLSLRDVEDLLEERGLAVSHETVRRWVNHFGPMIAADLRKRRQGLTRRGISTRSI